MKCDKIPPDTRVRPSARGEFFPGGDTAVLVIHGFTGIPEEMRYLARRLNEAGFTVSLPRLPGHGTNRYDFARTGARDWLRAAIDAYLELRDRYSRVFVTGLSMGGVITLILAARFPVERIALAAPALKANNRLLPLTPLLRLFMGRVRSSYTEKSDDPDRQYLAEEYWHWDSPASAAQLYALQRKSQRLLPEVRAKVLTIVSRGDTAVPLEVANLIEQRCAAPVKERLVLEDSPHVLVDGDEREKVADAIIRWFS